MKQIITTTEYYKQLCRWKKYHMEQHGCSEQDALEWAYQNVLNPPGLAGAINDVKVTFVNG